MLGCTFNTLPGIWHCLTFRYCYEESQGQPEIRGILPSFLSMCIAVGLCTDLLCGHGLLYSQDCVRAPVNILFLKFSSQTFWLAYCFPQPQEAIKLNNYLSLFATSALGEKVFHSRFLQVESSKELSDRSHNASFLSARLWWASSLLWSQLFSKETSSSFLWILVFRNQIWMLSICLLLLGCYCFRPYQDMGRKCMYACSGT
jgi:hypothetical protein